MNDFVIKKATRVAFKPLIGFYAESGAGKTFSALLLARGLVGDAGNVTMIDTEGGRGSIYADMIPGGYNVIDIEPPFPPGKLVDAIAFAESSGANVLVVDSASHFWEGIGGVLEWAAENEAEGKKGRQVWKDPKMAHERMVNRLLQTRLPVIVCMRAKHLLIEGKDPDTGKKTMFKDPNATPRQADDFIYGMTFHAQIRQDHSLNITKVSHPTLKSCFPATGPITIEHGRMLAKWCASPGKSSEPSKTSTAAKDPLKAKLWEKAQAYVGKGSTLAEVEAALKVKGITAKPLKDLTASEIGEAIDKIELEMNDLVP